MNFDVVVAGGGPAGAAAALTLAQAGRHVLLVDAGRGPRVGEGLAPGIQPLLRELGIYDGFIAQRPRISYGNLSAWGSDRLQGSDFISHPYGVGFQIDRVRFETMLRAAAHNAGAVVSLGTYLEAASASQKGHGFRLKLRKQATRIDVDCAWLVDATGSRSRIVRQFGVHRRQMDNLVAFHCRLSSKAGEDQDGRTLVEAVPDGWWYSSLLPSGERVAAYLTDLDLADRKALLAPAGFEQKLRQTVHMRELTARYRYGFSTKPSGMYAASGRLTRPTGRNWNVVGDAALTLDPLSSQGILNAIYTGVEGARMAMRALDGDLNALRAYAGQLKRIWTHFIQNHRHIYRAEARWQNRPFWQRRINGHAANWTGS